MCAAMPIFLNFDRSRAIAHFLSCANRLSLMSCQRLPRRHKSFLSVSIRVHPWLLPVVVVSSVLAVSSVVQPRRLPDKQRARQKRPSWPTCRFDFQPLGRDFSNPPSAGVSRGHKHRVSHSPLPCRCPGPCPGFIGLSMGSANIDEQLHAMSSRALQMAVPNDARRPAPPSQARN